MPSLFSALPVRSVRGIPSCTRNVWFIALDHWSAPVSWEIARTVYSSARLATTHYFNCLRAMHRCTTRHTTMATISSRMFLVPDFTQTTNSLLELYRLLAVFSLLRRFLPHLRRNVFFSFFPRNVSVTSPRHHRVPSCLPLAMSCFVSSSCRHTSLSRLFVLLSSVVFHRLFVFFRLSVFLRLYVFLRFYVFFRLYIFRSWIPAEPPIL